MTGAFSVHLDLLRIVAALVVVVSHFAYARFTRGDLQVVRDLNLGSDAVVVFFVLSGLVIAHAAGRDGKAGRFAFNRVTRLWSVALPALALTLLFDRIGARIAPEAYTVQWYHPLPPWEHFLRGLSFSNEWWIGGPVRLGSNGPWWSLSHEAAYYLLFGIAVFARGLGRVLLLAAVVAAVGLPVLLLMPCWLLGVLVWARIRCGGAAALPIGAAGAAAVATPLAYVLLLAADMPGHLAMLTEAALAPVLVGPVLRFSDEVLWNTVVALLAAIHILAMARLLAGRGPGRAAPAIRWAAGASFSIYAVHYPALHLVDVILPAAVPGRDAALLGATLALCFGFAAVFERPLPAIRAAILRAAGRRRAAEWS